MQCPDREPEATRFTASPSIRSRSRTLTRLLSLLAIPTMSSSSQTPGSSFQFKSIIDAALGEYKSKTGKDLRNNSLAKELQTCASAEAVLDIIQREAKAFDKFRDGDKRLMTWIGPSVDVLYTISATVGQGVGMVRKMIRDDLRCIQTSCAGDSFCECGLCRNRSPSRCSFICVSFCQPFNADVLQAAKDVRASHDVLVDLFERIQFFLKRLGVHTETSPTNDMVEILVKIMAEVLSILSIATKEVQQSRTSTLFLCDILN